MTLRGLAPQLPCLVSIVLCLAACDDADPSDAGRPDAQLTRDAALDDADVNDDAGLRDGAVSQRDAGPVPEGIPTLVAIGKFGRITTSCDGGRSWMFNRSDDDSASCEGMDCDHARGSSTGLAYGGGWFYASFGWGEPAMRVMRSRDGVAWETMYDNEALHFGGLAVAGERLVGATTQPHISTDGGATFVGAVWPEWDVPEGEWPVSRQAGFAPAFGGRIAVVAGDGGGSWGAIVVSRDLGQTFSAASVPAGCRGAARPPVFGGGVWILPWARSGVVCTSVDGGDSWAATVLADGQDLSPVVYTGAEHVLYAGVRAFRSADGAAWTESASDREIDALGYDPGHRSFVAIQRGRSYREQRFLRSEDGATWEELSASASARSHPITHIVFGWGATDGACAP